MSIGDNAFNETLRREQAAKLKREAQTGVNSMKPGDQMSDFKKALSRSIEAFWAEFASYHPDIVTGDLDPATVFDFDAAAAIAARRWLEVNK